MCVFWTCGGMSVAPVRALPPDGQRQWAARDRSCRRRTRVEQPVSVEPEVTVETEEWRVLVLDRADDAVLMDSASQPVSEGIVCLVHRAVRPELPVWKLPVPLSTPDRTTSPGSQSSRDPSALIVNDPVQSVQLSS